MANLFDYLDWRDISLEKVEFNEVDNLILARLSYFPLDGLIEQGELVPLQEVFARYEKYGTVGRILQKEDTELFPKLANSKRFGNVLLSDFVNQINPEEEKQFAAITVLLPDHTLYIAYRGTDNTIIGWKEDFNMSFQTLVPSQLDAVDYCNTIGKKFDNVIRVGGHSKGGNLAVYAAAFCQKEIRNRIIDVYNNDGPGFQEEIIQTSEYQEILPKVHTFWPQSSIIGRLLNHQEVCTILKSTQTGIMQHDLYSWQILGDTFVTDELTNSSEFLDRTITDWLNKVSPEQRGKFIDVLFEILTATQAQTLSEMGEKWFKTAKSMVKMYQNIDETSREILGKTLATFFSVAKHNIIIKKPSILYKTN